MSEQADNTTELSETRIEQLADFAADEHGELADLYAHERAKAASRLGADRSSAEWRAAERELHEGEKSN